MVRLQFFFFFAFATVLATVFWSVGLPPCHKLHTNKYHSIATSYLLNKPIWIIHTRKSNLSRKNLSRRAWSCVWGRASPYHPWCVSESLVCQQIRCWSLKKRHSRSDRLLMGNTPNPKTILTALSERLRKWVKKDRVEICTAATTNEVLALLTYFFIFFQKFSQLLSNLWFFFKTTKRLLD